MSYRDDLQELEREYWRGVIRLSLGNISRAAASVAINRAHLYEKLKKLDLCNPCRRKLRGNWHGL